MHRVLILGAGKIGALISGLLAESGSYRVQLADVDGAAAEAVVRATPWTRATRPRSPGTSPSTPWRR
jgi:saccharopine dehydrogenase-like NADP-dependent oxidoreductase